MSELKVSESGMIESSTYFVHALLSLSLIPYLIVTGILGAGRLHATQRDRTGVHAISIALPSFICQFCEGPLVSAGRVVLFSA